MRYECVEYYALVRLKHISVWIRPIAPAVCPLGGRYRLAAGSVFVSVSGIPRMPTDKAHAQTPPCVPKQ